MIPDVNKDAAGILKNIECFALDMDGTIYLGEQWIEGAREFLSAVEAAGKRYVFLTNNSSKNPQVCHLGSGNDCLFKAAFPGEKGIFTGK